MHSVLYDKAHTGRVGMSSSVRLMHIINMTFKKL